MIGRDLWRGLVGTGVWLCGLGAIALAAYATEQSCLDPLVALGFQLAVLHLTRRARRKAGELLFGDQPDAWGFAADFGQELARGDRLHRLGWHIVEDIGTAFGLVWDRLEVPAWGNFEWGHLGDVEMLTAPLVVGGREIGRLVLGPKPFGARLSDEERRLLDAVTHTVAICLHDALVVEALARRLRELGHIRGTTIDIADEIDSATAPVPRVIPLRRRS